MLMLCLKEWGPPCHVPGVRRALGDGELTTLKALPLSVLFSAGKEPLVVAETA